MASEMGLSRTRMSKVFDKRERETGKFMPVVSAVMPLVDVAKAQAEWHGAVPGEKLCKNCYPAEVIGEGR